MVSVTVRFLTREQYDKRWASLEEAKRYNTKNGTVRIGLILYLYRKYLTFQ